MRSSFSVFTIISVLVGVKSVFFEYESERIQGGHDAAIAEVPYQVSLVYYGEHICGGAIIKDDTILTVAHCLSDIRIRWLKVRSGTTIRTSGHLSFVKDILLHPMYEENENDVALVWLEVPLVFSTTVQRIQLPNRTYDPVGNAVAKISGWGYITGHGPLAYKVRKAEIPIVDRKVCEDLYYGRVHKNMVCAGYQQGEIDACEYDSGDPLIIDSLLIGLVSWGIGCGLPNYPGVYTNVAHFRSWIDENVK